MLIIESLPCFKKRKKLASVQGDPRKLPISNSQDCFLLFIWHRKYLDNFIRTQLIGVCYRATV